MTTCSGSLLVVACLLAFAGCSDAGDDDACVADMQCDEEPSAEDGESALLAPAPAFFVNVNTVSQGDGGTVSASSNSYRARCGPEGCTVLSGAQVSVTAVPATGYRFVRWSGCSDSTTSPLTINPRRTTTCTPNFAKAGFTVSARAGQLGSVSASAQGVYCPGAQCTVDYGASVTMNAAPASGASFVSWSAKMLTPPTRPASSASSRPASSLPVITPAEWSSPISRAMASAVPG